MAKLEFVKAARTSKKVRACGKCSREILKGDSYFHWTMYFRGPEAYRCVDHKPEPWEVESNEKRAAIMRGQNAWGLAQDAETPEDAAGHIRDAVGEAETARDLFQEAVDGWSGTGLEMSEMAQNFEYAVDELDSWISEAETLADDLEGWAPDEPEDGEEGEDWADLLANVDEFPEPDF